MAASALVTAGEPERAERVARGVSEPRRQMEALIAVARASAAAGDRERAQRLLSDAEQVAYRVDGPVERRSLVDKVARALVSTREYRRAKEFAEHVGLPERYWHKLLGEMFTAEVWEVWRALPMVAVLYPQIAVRIVDALRTVASRTIRPGT